jgi:small subunit ribosomal protein S4
MGDPRRVKRKFDRPGHPWQKARLEEEKVLKYEYRLKNKKELYKANSLLKSFSNQAKKLNASSTKQSEIETELFIKRLSRLGLIAVSSKLDDVLNLKPRNLLERRLQTILFRKGLARSLNQARQFISHRHVMVGDNIVDVPGYIVPVGEEASIAFSESSGLSNPEHPERAPEEVENPKEEAKPEKKEKRPVKRPAKGKPAKKTEKKEVKK